MQSTGIVQFIREKLNKTQFYSTTVNGSRIVACFGVDTYGELTKYMQVKHKADVGILINTADKSVKMIHFTQNTFNFNKFANILELKAVKNIATGLINNKIVEFTKRLIVC